MASTVKTTTGSRRATRARFDSPLSRHLIATGRFLATVAVTFLGLLLVTFLIGRVMPIDPVLAVVGDRASSEVYDAARIRLGLDQPLYTQFLIYITNVIEGDFGKSMLTSRPVIDDIIRVFPATLELATVATILGILIGVPCGVVAAIEQGRNGYTVTHGLPELRAGILEQVRAEFDWDPAVLVTSGVSGGLVLTMMACLNPGDEVVVPVPYWVSYPDIVLLAGAKPVFAVADAGEYKGDALTNLRILGKMGLKVNHTPGDSVLRRALASDCIVVDAVFGTGFSGEPRGRSARFIQIAARAADRSGIPVVAVDIASGVDASTGVATARALPADTTVTFHVPKVGHFVAPGSYLSGDVILADIGIPAAASAAADHFLTAADQIAAMIPPKMEDRKSVV